MPSSCVAAAKISDFAVCTNVYNSGTTRATQFKFGMKVTVTSAQLKLLGNCGYPAHFRCKTMNVIMKHSIIFKSVLYARIIPSLPYDLMS